MYSIIPNSDIVDAMIRFALTNHPTKEDVDNAMKSKQNALTSSQTDAVDSGVTKELVAKLKNIEEGAQKNPDLSEYAKKSDIPAAPDLSGYAKTAEVPYALIEVPLAERINLTDRAINKVTADDSLCSITFIFPEKKKGVSRDFFVRLVITGETVPTISFVEPNGDAVSFDVDDDSWAEIEQGVNILMFTDTEE